MQPQKRWARPDYGEGNEEATQNMNEVRAAPVTLRQNILAVSFVYQLY
jgi:hypothetical protein